MDVTIETASHDEIAAFLRPIMVAFGRIPDPDDERTKRFAEIIEPDRMHVAREDGAIVGAAGAFTYELTVPGGFVPAAGVTVVGVLPTHRRRGILRSLMREQLDDVRRRGEPVAYLWASEEGIYGRFGYGVASLVYEAKIDVTRLSLPAPSEPLSARMLDADAAWEAIPAIYDSVRARHPGMFSRSEAWWRKRRLLDGQAGPTFRVVLERDGEPVAYALYRVTMDFDEFAASLDGVEAMGVDDGATLAIWRYLASIDLVKTLKAELLPADHPLLLAANGIRPLGVTVWDGLWVRVVDVEAALAARQLGDGEVVLELEDAFCDWNAGRWLVTADGARPTDEEPHLRADATALGSAYLGGFSWSQLARAGRVREVREGALRQADAMFASERAPWCPEIF